MFLPKFRFLHRQQLTGRRFQSHMGIVSLINTDKLFWLGRYSERVYTTIRLFGESFDKIIDGDVKYIELFCRSLDIPNIYDSTEDYVERYLFDSQNPDSVYSNLTRAYDNAMTLCEEKIGRAHV